MISALYRGEVRHLRVRPRPHALRYRVFWLLLDLDELDAGAVRTRLLSRNRFNLLSFHDRDHGDGSDVRLQDQVRGLLRQAGLDAPDGPIRLLTMPRVLGYVFNPISLYYCHRADGGLAAMVYEVTSTFGERRAYVLPVAERDAAGGVIRQRAAKALHVSPFLHMDMRYHFTGRAPTETVHLAVAGDDADGPLIRTSLQGRRRPLTDGALLAAVAAVPLLTFKVTAAIHWEALKLWLKGTPLVPRPG